MLGFQFGGRKLTVNQELNFCILKLDAANEIFKILVIERKYLLSHL